MDENVNESNNNVNSESSGSPADKLEPTVIVDGKAKKMHKVSRYLIDMMTSEE